MKIISNIFNICIRRHHKMPLINLEQIEPNLNISEHSKLESNIESKGYEVDLICCIIIISSFIYTIYTISLKSIYFVILFKTSLLFLHIQHGTEHAFVTIPYL